jgi:HK97 family phage major capsid protein
MELKDFLEAQEDKCKKRLDEIDKEVEEIKEKNEKSEDEAELKELGDTLAELEAEKVELEAELKEVEAQIDALDKPKKDPEGNPEGARSKFLVFEKEERGNEKMNEELRKQLEERAVEFKKSGRRSIPVKELRAVTIASGTIATPTEVDPYIRPTFNQVSSIVDLVKKTNAVGMGAYKVAYEVSIGTTNAQTEGQNITESNPTYAFKTITPASYGIISAITNQVMKQSPLDYEGKIVDSAEKSLRVKAASIITNAIVSDTLLAKPTNLKISAIDEKTLRNIALNYGSDESVYGNAWLFLTKADLIAFGDVRSDTTLQSVYEITPDANNVNTGVIKDGGLSVRYCLNPNLTALADAEANGVSMIYGQPENFELALFSDYEVKVSEDYQFAANMLTIRGTVDLGGSVVKKDGFIAVTKASE